ncbi:hypothetical protein ACFJGW_19930 [Burkholderiaceae bacterium UC74_6]
MSVKRYRFLRANKRRKAMKPMMKMQDFEPGAVWLTDPDLHEPAPTRRLTLRYLLEGEDGVERQIDCTSMADVLHHLDEFGPQLRHAFVFDGAGTTVLEAGRDDRRERERPDHADWPQTE